MRESESITTVQACPGFNNFYSKLSPIRALSRPARSAGFPRHAVIYYIYGLCCTTESELMICVNVEVGVLDSPSHTVPTVSGDVISNS